MCGVNVASFHRFQRRKTTIVHSTLPGSPTPYCRVITFIKWKVCALCTNYVLASGICSRTVEDPIFDDTVMRYNYIGMEEQ